MPRNFNTSKIAIYYITERSVRWYYGILYEYWPIPHINYAFTARESSTTEPHSPQHTVMWNESLSQGSTGHWMSPSPIEAPPVHSVPLGYHINKPVTFIFCVNQYSSTQYIIALLIAFHHKIISNTWITIHITWFIIHRISIPSPIICYRHFRSISGFMGDFVSRFHTCKIFCSAIVLVLVNTKMRIHD